MNRRHAKNAILAMISSLRAEHGVGGAALYVHATQTLIAFGRFPPLSGESR